MTVHVFVGPTLPAGQVLAINREARLHRPIVHGDLLRLGPRANDVVVIIDGGYHHFAPVRHKEILSLLAAGVTVVGCSSMGALRAAELAPYGMVGHGVVFDMYRLGAIDADDEVAVTHGEGPEYRQFSEPLVNVRYALEASRREGRISPADEAAIVAIARDIPYSARTWRGIERTIARDYPALRQSMSIVRAFLDDRPELANIKTTDAIETLRRLDEIVAEHRDGPLAWSHSPDWQHRQLFEWTANSTGSALGEVWVEFGAMIRYQQLYDEDFPSRWRRFAFRGMLSSRGSADLDLTDRELEARALALASEKGLHGASLTTEQRSEWLLGGELELPEQELLRRTLVRSYRSPRGVYDLMTAEPDLCRDDDVRRAVAESYVVNDTVTDWGPGQSINHIKDSVLHDHLIDVWGLAGGDADALKAAARDRGFPGVAEAAEAARPFFLSHRIRATG